MPPRSCLLGLGCLELIGFAALCVTMCVLGVQAQSGSAAEVGCAIGAILSGCGTALGGFTWLYAKWYKRRRRLAEMHAQDTVLVIFVILLALSVLAGRSS